MAHSNKNEIRIYFETNDVSLKELEQIFRVPYRTLARWAKVEKWERAKALSGIKVQKSEILQSEYNALLDVSKSAIKDEMRKNLGENAYSVDEMVLDNLLSESTDKILLSAMSLNYIQKNAALSVLLAKDELLNLVKEAREKGKSDPMIIACAEKVAKLFLDLQGAFYGRDVKIINAQVEQDLSALSDEELARQLAALS